MIKYNIKDLFERNLILFSAISGSNAYGTNTPESDKDIRGIFIQPLNDVLKYGYIDQIADEKNDIIYYEIGRFVHLLTQNNPNIIELLNMPDDCIIYRHPLYTEFFENNLSKFLSKRVKFSFGAYAINQIKKAKGYNKKINWEENSITRKNVLDFCYILKDNDSISFNSWLSKYSSLTQKNYALAAINHAHDLYAMYELPKNIEYGIISDEETSNDVQLYSIPKELEIKAYLYFNKDGYSSHCKKYKEYQDWIKNRNENRFKMNKEHGKNYDSKNMMHTYRLLLMTHELAKGNLLVRRTPEEINKLMKIRRGEYEYDDLLIEVEKLNSTIDEEFKISNLPDNVDIEFALDILLKIRQHFYLNKNTYN
ncbi:nucleotidyltransferase domain-containing protein [bacterium]|jgi:predicted nucleotidyltransferase|nr:nucleotidyltransferase domain-containing protein [bacterium]